MQYVCVATVVYGGLWQGQYTTVRCFVWCTRMGLVYSGLDTSPSAHDSSKQVLEWPFLAGLHRVVGMHAGLLVQQH